MTEARHLHDAVTAGLLAADEAHRGLLRATVESARAIFAAAAASVFLLDEETSELVFEAVSGEGSAELVGRRLPAGTGVAGTVLLTGEPMILDDLADDPSFAREAAESTGFVPSGLMAVPLLAGERAIGVLEVLDRRDRSRTALEELALLSLFATQAGLALELLRRSRRASGAAAEEGGDAALLARLASLLGRLGGEQADEARHTLTAVERLLARL